MKLKIISRIGKEIIHFAEGKTIISSKYRTIFWEDGKTIRRLKLPEPNLVYRVLGLFRLSRRAFRLDKCNVFLHNDRLIIIRQGFVYLYDPLKQRLTKTLKLTNCRNVLHQSISVTPEGFIYFGEYGKNKNRDRVPVYRSIDGGESWQVIYAFPPKSIKHIHGCYYDKFTDKIWVCTGDFANENFLLMTDKDFINVKKIGDGQQRYRTCNLIFTKNKVHWLMDSQLEPSYHIIFDRKTEEIEVGQQLMGPIWYVKKLVDNSYLAASAQEIGAGVLDDKIHLYHSVDLKNWNTIETFEHDKFPKRYFKFGVIGFADGMQSIKEFYMFFEAVRGLDGKSLKCTLE